MTLKHVLARVGKDVAAGYAAFLIFALFVPLVAVGGSAGSSMSLVDILADAGLAGFTERGASGRGIFLVLLAAATAAVPCLWKHPLAPLAHAAPLALTAAAFLPVMIEHRARARAIEGLGELTRLPVSSLEQLGPSFGEPFLNLKAGAWALFAVVVYLAIRGAARATARA